MGGLLFASFLAHFFGFIGPFAAMGIIFIIYAFFLNAMIEFIPKGAIIEELTNVKKNESSTESENCVEMVEARGRNA